MTTEIWAHCPNCSDDYPKRFDIRLRLAEPSTHTARRMDCPDCHRDVRMSIGSPTIFEPSEVPRHEFTSQEVTELIDSDTVIVGKPRHDWIVYVLECKWRSTGDRGYADWKFAASKASKRLYVGSTDNLKRRIKEHKLTGSREFGYDSDTHFSGSKFTKKFKPKRLYEISRVATKQEARRREELRAEELKTDYPGYFVWQS